MQAKQEEEWEAERLAREKQDEIDARNGKEVTRRIGCSFPEARRRTLQSLNDRAVELLKGGKNALATGVCVQIVELDPMHNFDKDFWDNVTK